MRIVLDEQALIDKYLDENCVDDKNPAYTARLLAKHYFLQDMDKKQVRESIESFMSKNYIGFNVVKWKDRLDRIVNGNKKNPDIIKIDNIKITINELNRIKTIENDNLERLAFVYLVYSKIFNQLSKNPDYWVNEKIGEILKDTKITKGINTTRDQQRLVNGLHDYGLISYARRVDCTNDKVLFADEESEVVITITDFRNFVYEYLRWKGESIVNCNVCGILTTLASNRQLYCRVCWKQEERILKRNWKREYDKNKKVEV